MHRAVSQSRPAAPVAVAALAIGLAFAATLAGCTRHATQLMVVIESDLDQNVYRCIGIEVARITEGQAVVPTQYQSFNVPVQTDVPFSFGVLPPGGDASVRVEIRAEARTDCQDPNVMPPVDQPVVRTVIRAGFSPALTLRLPIFLGTRCTDVMCPDRNSCDPRTGVCEPVREATHLVTVRPGDELADSSVSDAGTDANLTGGQCPLEIDNYALPATGPRVFGLAITQPSLEWVILYSDAGSLHAIRYPYDGDASADAPAWNVGSGADAIAIEGLADDDSLIALVNPPGSSELVRYAGPIGGPPVSSSIGTGRLVQYGRHSVRFGDRIAAVVERDGGATVIGVGASDAIQEIFVSTTPVEIALGNTASGALIVAISGDDCEVRTFDDAGLMTATSTIPGAGTCAARAVARLDDGSFVLVYSTGALLGMTLGTMSTRLNPNTYVSPVAALLGNDSEFRVAWSDVYDYPMMPPDPGPLEPGIIYQTNFGIGETISEYTDHGDSTTNHDLTRWERLGERTGLVMVPADGFLFRSICRPTPGP